MNTMSTQKRKYELRARRQTQDRTRQRIVEVTSQLHEEVGPFRTTIAEIARRAGVQRLTVYKHFPTEGELFAACGAHWLVGHAPPDTMLLLDLDDPVASLRRTLHAFYGWYRDNESMIANIRRDRLLMPVLDAAVTATWDYDLATLAADFASSLAATRRDVRLVRAAVALSLDFWAWRRLHEEGLDTDVAVDLMMKAVAAAST